MFVKTKLSVNINKIATLRNARGNNTPDLLHLTKSIIKAGAHGITLHPRPDERHIRYQDVLDIKNLLQDYKNIDFNIEGYPSQSFLKLIESALPQQCTLVPDPPSALTSNAGWDFVKNKVLLISTVKKLKSINVSSSLFLDPFSMDKIQWEALKQIAPNSIELYTQRYAENYCTPQKEKTLLEYKKTAEQAIGLQIKINAGHDLNQKNLLEFLKNIPQLQEVSIGQALISEALEQGLQNTVKSYLHLIQQS